jgi:hypothetical protein
METFTNFMETTIKMSQYEIASPLPSGSYFIVVAPDGSVWNNRRVSMDDILTTIKSDRWKPVPEHFDSVGNDGDEARDGDGNYYLHTGGAWRRYGAGPQF